MGATSAATRAAASGYEAGDAEAAGAVRTVITTLSGADRQAG
ncbi:MAG: hypothetical protein QJR12_17080 [Mycobacterium sp.]|nr:hypothetical protein [Mycobacterium sp.]MDI3315917.1 hypothetical protein [Mycobacterium sp.]MDI3315922.1 hypothetical protein [Mycobacterium sp.]